MAARIDQEVRRLLDEGYAMALKAIDDHRERFDQLVAALLAHDTLSRAEFVGLMETGVVPVVEDDDKPRPAAAIPVEPEAPAQPAPVPDKPELPEDILTRSDDDDKA